jgi:putative sterol carrier protein
LAGTLVIELTNLGERFLFDWRDDEPKVSPVEGPIQLAQGEQSDAGKVDCVVSLTEQSLMSIRSGDLNPQLAMLADKVKVKGKVAPAVYLFNLVAPRERQ